MEEPATPQWQAQAKALYERAVTWVRAQMEARDAAHEAQVARLRAVGQQVMAYKGEKAMRAGIADMARQGYRVASQSSHQPRSGCLRIILLGGIGALIWKPKPIFTVIYEGAK